MIETLDSYSLVGVYSAMAVYTIAFVLFTIDLARRGAQRGIQQDAALAEVPMATSAANADATRAAGQTSDSAVATLTSMSLEDAAGEALPTSPTSGPRYLRAAMALTVIAWVIHTASTVLRGVAAGRVPWANMFEFTLTGTAIIVAVFLVAQFWQDLKYLGAFIIGFVLVALGVATVAFYVDVVPLPPALQSGWLVIHVFVASLSMGFFALGAALAVLQLLRNRPAAGDKPRARFIGTLPPAERLENLSYQVNIVGFVFWTFTLIAGAIWAREAWGRYWGWDTKEVWTFIIWVLYAGYIHARATRGWRGNRAAWLSLVAATAIVFNYTIVNLYFQGWHAYSGL